MEDQRLHDLMQQAVATLEPPTRRLVETGLRRGRRQRRRIRAAELATGAAVVVGIAVLGATLLSGSGGRRGTVGEPAGRGPGGTVTMTSQALLQTALETLPRRGRTSGYSGAFLDGLVDTSFVYDDGHGAAAIDVSMAYRAEHTTPKNVTAPAPCTAGSAGCTVFRDGSHAQVNKGHQYNDARTPNAAEWSVDLVRPDGVWISIIEWNAPQPKDAAPTRDTPPFTLAQLSRWAHNPGWRVEISTARAASARHLFKAGDLSAKTSADTSMDAAKCRQAVRAKKIPASACPTPR